MVIKDSTSLSAAGLTAGALISGLNGARLAPVTPERAQHLALLDSLEDGCVVLVATAGDPRTYQSLNGLARLSIGARVRVYPCDLPPTVLATCVAVMNAGRFGPGDTLEILRTLQTVTTTVAISNSVSRLTAPAPSIWQHLRGLLPGSAFVIDLPGHRVLTGARALPRLKRVHDGTLVLASAPDELSVRWRQELAGLTVKDPQPPRFVMDHVDPAGVPWPAPSWAEMTGLAVTIDEFAARLQQHLVHQTCHSCLLPVAGTICPMCGIVCQPASSAGSAGPPAPVPVPLAGARFDAISVSASPSSGGRP